MRRVSGASASASEPTNISPSPKPTASGAPCRAAISMRGWPAKTAASAKAPCTRFSAAAKASGGAMPCARCQSTRRTKVSVSVSVSNSAPSASSSARSSAWFSMMPLCTTLTRPVLCGWALRSVGAPCVAQRVWPMPVVPGSGARSSTAARLPSLPSARRRSMWPFTRVAMPALS